ncbi:MAG: hypothetical protein Q8Q59_04030 [Luteolibacter sp.]|jgi:hypothetical protein|nr:hypothetical protein [Luteolibacter sp.]
MTKTIATTLAAYHAGRREVRLSQAHRFLAGEMSQTDPGHATPAS